MLCDLHRQKAGNRAGAAKDWKGGCAVPDGSGKDALLFLKMQALDPQTSARLSDATTHSARSAPGMLFDAGASPGAQASPARAPLPAPRPGSRAAAPSDPPVAAARPGRGRRGAANGWGLGGPQRPPKGARLSVQASASQSRRATVGRHFKKGLKRDRRHDDAQDPRGLGVGGGVGWGAGLFAHAQSRTRAVQGAGRRGFRGAQVTSSRISEWRSWK